MENPITKFKLCETFPFDAVLEHSKTSTVKPIWVRVQCRASEREKMEGEKF